MQQTLLALVALLIATMLSFNQKQASLQGQQQVVRAELEQMALGVATQSMQMIRARAFDAATRTASSDSVVKKSNFKPESSFPSGNRCKPFFPKKPNTSCKAVEDFHEMAPATRTFEFPTGNFKFEITDVKVRYVKDDFSDASGKTYQKQVILKVQDVPSGGGSPRLAEPIKYSEVVSYP